MIDLDKMWRELMLLDERLNQQVAELKEESESCWHWLYSVHVKRVTTGYRGTVRVIILICSNCNEVLTTSYPWNIR